MSKEKKICDWSKRDLKERFAELQAIVEQPSYACLKCGRAACAKKWLCKAEPLKKTDR